MLASVAPDARDTLRSADPFPSADLLNTQLSGWQQAALAALDQTLSDLRAAAGALYVADHEHATLQLVCQRGVAPAYLTACATLPLTGSMIGETIAQRQLRYVRATEAAFEEACLARAFPNAAAALIAPLKLATEADGVLVAGGTSMDEAETLAAASPAVEHLASILHGLRLSSQIEKDQRELDLLLHSSNSLTAPGAIDEALHRLARELAEGLPVTACRVLLWDRQTQQLHTRATYGLREISWTVADGQPIPVSASPCAFLAITEGQVVIARRNVAVAQADDILIEPLLESDPIAHLFPNVQSSALIPFAHEGQMIGLIVLGEQRAWERTALTPNKIRICQALANQAAIAIQNARLFEAEQRARRLAETLREVAAVFNAASDLATALDLALAYLERVLSFESASLLLLQRDADGKEVLSIQAARGFPQGLSLIGYSFSKADFAAFFEQPTPAPMIIDEPQQRADWVPIVGTEYIRSWLGAPLVVNANGEQRLIGILAVDSARPHAFTAEDASIAVAFAHQAAAAIERARLHAEAERRVHELSALTQVSEALHQAVDLDRALVAVLDAVFALASQQMACIFLVSPGSQALQIAAARGLDQSRLLAFNQRRWPASLGPIGEALRSSQVVVSAAPHNDPRAEHLGGLLPVETAFFPMVSSGGPIGVLAIDRAPDPAMARLLGAIANVAATAIEKLRLFEDQQRRALQLQIIREVAERFLSILDSQTLLREVVRLIQARLGYSEVSLWLRHETQPIVILRAAAGVYEPAEGSFQRPIDSTSIVGWVAAHGEPLLVNDVTQEPRFRFDPHLAATCAELAVPLRLADMVIGVLDVQADQPYLFDQDDLFMLQALADQTAIALENARLYASERARVAELDRAYSELRQLDRLKDEFVQNVSHELRTPLTFVKGYIELLQDEVLGELTAAQRDALQIMAERTDFIIRLVNDIVSLKKADLDMLKRQRLSLIELARDCLHSAEVTARKAGLKLDLVYQPDLPDVWGDRARLSEVFDNLIGNAIKFSPNGGSIVVRLYQDGAYVRVDVTDEGIGIPADKLDLIWERFYQVDGSTRRRFGGTGLGLTIVRRIVQAHEGKVWATSQEGKGSTFSFVIPIYIPGQEGALKP
jgi:signal transduction histidine kinase